MVKTDPSHRLVTDMVTAIKRTGMMVRNMLINMVRPARFERATPAFGGQYSIQLSYRREGVDYSRFCLGALC